MKTTTRQILAVLLTLTLGFSGTAFIDIAKADSGTQAGTGTITSFAISGLSGSIQPNQSMDITVTALDQNQQTVQSYTGTVHFSAEGQNSANVILPQDYTFTASDLGTHTFSLGLTFKVAGTYKVDVTDLSNTLITGSQSVTVGSGSMQTTQQSGSTNITLDSPVAGTYAQNTQVVSGTAVAGDTVIIYDNQQQIGTVQVTPDGKYSYQTSPLSDGQHSVYAELTDSSQNQLGKSNVVEFSIQTAPPSVTNITLTPSTPVNPGDTVNVSITSEKNLSQAAIVFNGDIVNLNPSLSDPTVYTGNIQAPSTPGTYSIDVLLVDQLSNEGSYKGQAQIIVNSTQQSTQAQTQQVQPTQQTQQVTQQSTQQQFSNPPPSKVTGVLAYAGNMKVTLVWDAAVDNATYIQHYRVYYGTNPQSLTQYVDTKDASTTWYVPNLENGKQYYFSVSAFDPQGQEGSALSDVVNATPFTTEVSGLGQVTGPIQPTHPAPPTLVTPPPATSSTGPELLWFMIGSGGLGGLIRIKKRKK